MRKTSSLFALAPLLLALSAPAAAQSGGLPGGASSLNETHGDWTVICAVVEAETRCLISQNQTDGQSGQRLLTLELVPAADGGAEGVLVLPFGLALMAGAGLAVDETPLAAAALPFSTCLPLGCLVPLDLAAEQLAALKAGQALAIATHANEGGQEIVFSVSLKGFTSALDRAAGLLGR